MGNSHVHTTAKVHGALKKASKWYLAEEEREKITHLFASNPQLFEWLPFNPEQKQRDRLLMTLNRLSKPNRGLHRLVEKRPILTVSTLHDLLRVLCDCFFRCIDASEPVDESILPAMVSLIFSDYTLGNNVSALVKHCERHWPGLGAEFSLWVLVKCLGSPPPFAGSTIATSSTSRWQLSLLPVNSSVKGTGCWSALYSFGTNGRSVQALYRALAYYPAPTLLLIKTAAGDVFGYYCDVPWRASVSSFFGSSNCFLFALLPTLAVLKSTGYASNYANLNATGKQIACGLGMGGQLEAFRLSVDEDLQKGTSLTFDSTFFSPFQLCARGALEGDPALADSVHFDVDAMECWGLGDSMALAEQERQRKKATEEAMKRRQVDRNIVLGGDEEDNVDMMLLDLGGAHTSYVKEANHV